MPTLELETMRCEMEGPLARLRLNRPEALNAANWAWVNDLVTATSALAGTAEARVVIVSGEGRAFCSGLDVKELARGSLSTDWFATWERGVTALANLDAVTIAAVHGYCLGGGLQLAQELLSIPFPALLYTKHQIDRAFGQDTATLLNEMTAVYEDCLHSPEHDTVKADLLAREKQT